MAEIVNTGAPPDLEKLALVMAKNGLIPVIPKNDIAMAAVSKVAEKAAFVILTY